ncbi:MAG: hypothetical protein AB7N61_12085 [Acidimicrobiia bacterium]
MDQCIATKVADGLARPEAIAACVATDKPTATSAPKAAPTIDRSSDGDGTSSVTTAAVAGVLGVVVGVAAATVLGRRRRGVDREVRGSSSLPAPSPSPVASNPMPPPGAAVDRSARLIDVLIDLSDRVNSTALRTDIDDALAAAGVRRIDIAPGTAFDAATMRGVGTVPASDASRLGLVASMERCGYADAGRVIRVPDVTVHRAE